jgi:hypothetical protein
MVRLRVERLAGSVSHKSQGDALLQRWAWLGFLLLALLLIGCSGTADQDREELATDSSPLQGLLLAEATAAITARPAVPLVDLTLAEEDVSVEPLPLRAGFPFTVTAVIHNQSALPAVDVPVMVYLSAGLAEIGYTSFLQLLTVTVPATSSLPVEVPVNWNLAGGEYRLWIQVNRVPDAWQPRMPTQPETDRADNIVLLDLMVDPFDAYRSDLCSGRVDVEIGPTDVLPEPDRQRVLVRVHNVGNQAVYNLPVVVTGNRLIGIAYTPAIAPCGGTAEVYVQVDRPFQEGESLTVQVNPDGWTGRLEEDNLDNNRIAVSAGLPSTLAPGLVVPPASGVEDYDFSLSATDIEIPELWTVLVTVHNLGTRDAAMVPIRVENEAGRKLVDAVPLVQGEGLGVAAIRVGYLWTPGGVLTFTVNPEDTKGAYPETKRDNNVATFTLP